MKTIQNNKKKNIYAIILSGGIGTRVGKSIPKQYIEIGNNKRPLIYYSMNPFFKSAYIDGVQVVADETWHEYISEVVQNIETKLSGTDVSFVRKEVCFSKPGATRQLSIYNALVDLRNKLKEDDIVIIHDAARPNLSVDMIESYIGAMYGALDNITDNWLIKHHAVYDGVIPVLPMKDTVYLSSDGHTISNLVDRNTVYAGQAPELFIYGKYLAANEALIEADPPSNPINPIMRINGSTEPAVLAGMDIAMVPGDERNYKITTMEDLRKFVDDDV